MNYKIILTFENILLASVYINLCNHVQKFHTFLLFMGSQIIFFKMTNLKILCRNSTKSHLITKVVPKY